MRGCVREGCVWEHNMYESVLAKVRCGSVQEANRQGA